MRSFFRERLIRYCCLAVALTSLSLSASCQKKSSLPASQTPSQPEDHFVGTWKLDQDRTPPPPLFRSNSPADELITITREGDAYVLTWFPRADRSYEQDRVVIGDTKKLGIGVGVVNGKLQAHGAYVERKDSNTIIEGSEFSRTEYTVLPDQRTLRVKLQTVNMDNAYQWELIYDRT
jgi:hypothetical protein